MAKTYAALKAEILSELQDVNAAVWNLSPNTTEVETKLNNAILEVSEYHSYYVLYRFEIESRTGTATSTTAGSLVDSQGQFLSTDTGKVIYNTTDHTWATATYADANTLTLTGDIMVSGESYEMYNEGCRSNREIYIGDVTDYVGDHHGVALDHEHATEYPKGTRRSVEINGNVLTLLLDSDPNDSADADADVDVFVWFKVNQRVSQLTDLAGALTGAFAAGLASVEIDALQTTGTFAQDTLFTIANCRGTYRATADATITDTVATVAFFPALEDAVLNNAVVTITGSTLDTRLERLVVAIASGKAQMSKAGMYATTDYGGTVWKTHFDLGQARYLMAINELKESMKASSRRIYSRA